MRKVALAATACAVGLGTTTSYATPVAAAAVEGTALPAGPAHRDHRREQRNRALVLRFCEAVYNRRDFAVAARLLAADFIQHNPKIPTGRQGFIDSYAGVVARHPDLHSQVVRSAASGDLVWTHVRVTDASGTYRMALVNIFRVSRGRIVEHWDVLQSVPETTSNGNSMF